MAFLNGTNGPVYYEVYGEGIPILFTHGASWNHRLWEPQVDALKEKYKVIVWDVRGHGKSRCKEDQELNGEIFIQDLIELLDHLSIEKTVLCGLSMGGIISMQTAIMHPGRVAGIIAIGAPCSFRFNKYEQMMIPIQRLMFNFIPIKAFARAQGIYFSRYNPSNRLFIEEAVLSLTQKDWSSIWSALTRMDCRERLSTISCPTLILQGEHDIIIRHQQEYMAQTIPGAKWEVIENAAHATNRDNAPRVNELIKNFMTETAGKVRI
ncbi:alpha/beta hydrolase [Bacillus sp. H-16]|uniref:alpha/beta fold hydrolase n=1 Tax=Alteribacter salitolerans TaxID=2912333 RepID=UPI00196389A3|nr:alpha/beta hydrolase [Alteribacter salitolerans]